MFDWDERIRQTNVYSISGSFGRSVRELFHI